MGIGVVFCELKLRLYHRPDKALNLKYIYFRSILGSIYYWGGLDSGNEVRYVPILYN